MTETEKTFDIGDRVVIKHTGRGGTIVGVWRSLYGTAQYQVRYSDRSDTVHDFWFTVVELELMIFGSLLWNWNWN